MLRRTQARIVEGCVENAFLFDCQTRTLYVNFCLRVSRARLYGAPSSYGATRSLPSGTSSASNQLDDITEQVLEITGQVMRMADGRKTMVAILG